MSILETGAVFGRDFRIVKALRTGGMGAVYVADQLSTGKQRALKVMAPELVNDPATRERFVLEARAAARIESDHVVEIVTAGIDEESGAPFLVMELLKGEELADCLERTGALPLGDVAEILQQVGHALEQAHQHGIVHRDLKLENIFLCASRRRDVQFTAKVLDFGIAKLVADSQKTGTQPLGTPLFMAPEQTDRKGKICPATDVWALGLIAFRLLTNRDFWREADGSLAGLLREVCLDDIPFASVRAAELEITTPLPVGFDAWFARCVHRDVDARFQEAGEAVRAFAELVATDAPRGAISVNATGPVTGVVAPSPGAASGSRPLQVIPRGGSGPVIVNAATVAATGEASVAGRTGEAFTPVEGKSSSKAWIAIPVAAALAAGAFAFTRDKGASGIPSAPSAMATSPVITAAPPASAAVVALKTKCPPGTALISGGGMFMGARDLNDDAKPPHEVMVSAFCLDITEVTTKAYTSCVETGMCERALEQVSWPKITDDQKKRYSPLCNYGHPERGDHPINCVAWPMADNYCKKHAGRLPTEAEWEFAARGSSQRNYPWGDAAPSAKYLNACGTECVAWGKANADKHEPMYAEDDKWPATAPVGSFPAGAAMKGIMDMAGNVWEWTSDWFAPYTAEGAADPKGPPTGTQRVLRGGDFFGFQPDWARPAYRWKTDPESYNHAIGFRCAADAK